MYHAQVCQGQVTGVRGTCTAYFSDTAFKPFPLSFICKTYCGNHWAKLIIKSHNSTFRQLTIFENSNYIPPPPNVNSRCFSCLAQINPKYPKSGEVGPIQPSPLSTFSISHTSQDLCSVPPAAKDLSPTQPPISHNFYGLQLDATAEKLLIKGSIPGVSFRPGSPYIPTFYSPSILCNYFIVTIWAGKD